MWRSFLTDEYSKSFAKAGGIGIADHVYRSLLAQQEARAQQSSKKRQGRRPNDCDLGPTMRNSSITATWRRP